MTGIYKITNKINGNSYIGQAKDIYKRWKKEKQESKRANSESYNYPLMRAFRKYGIENFIFEILEECKIEDLNEREIYWIAYYDTFFNGYNQTLGGDNSAVQPKEKIIGVMSDLINTDMLHKEIALKWGISTEMVQGINTGRYWKHDADYPLQKQYKRKATIYYCEKCGKEISHGAKLCLECHTAKLNSIKTNIPDKEILFKHLNDNQGNFTAVGKIYNVSSTTIRKWCVRNGLSNHSSDYKPKKIKKEAKEQKRIVVQLDKNTCEELKCFESISEALRCLGLKNDCGSHISDACSGKRKSAYGYKWKYA